MLTEGQLLASLRGYTKIHKRPESNPKCTSPLLCDYKVKMTCMTHTSTQGNYRALANSCVDSLVKPTFKNARSKILAME